MEERADYKTRFQGKGVGVSGNNPSIGARFPEPYHSKLMQMPNRADYVRQSVITFLDLENRNPAILKNLADLSKVINEALALIEEKGLLEELAKRVDS